MSDIFPSLSSINYLKNSIFPHICLAVTNVVTTSSRLILAGEAIFMYTFNSELSYSIGIEICHVFDGSCIYISD